MHALAQKIARCLIPCICLAGCPSAGASPVTTRTAGAPSAAGAGSVSRQLLLRQDVRDLPGWETRLYLVEYPPGIAAPPHIHPEVGVGYVLSGRFESAFEGESPTVVEQGQSFIEKASAVHTLFRNPATDRPLRFLIAFTIRQGEEPLRPVAAVR